MKGYKCYNPITRKDRRSRDVVFDESASWYAAEKSLTPTPLGQESVDIALENEDGLTLMFEDSPTTARLSAPREPSSDQSIGRPSPRLDKGKAKMSEYEDLNDNVSTHSIDNEFEGLDIPIIQTAGAKKALEYANEKLRRSSHEKTPISCFGYNDYMAYHYAYMMKVTSVREPETFSYAAKEGCCDE